MMTNRKQSYTVVIQSVEQYPIPQINRKPRKKRISKYAFMSHLLVGNSVFMPFDVFPYGSANAALTKCRKAVNPPRVFTTRVRTENGIKGMRIWRTA